MASDMPGARREASVVLTAPSSWKMSHASAWPEQLSVQFAAVGEPHNGQQATRITIQLDSLPQKGVKEGVAQLFANDGKDLVTVKVSLVWP